MTKRFILAICAAAAAVLPAAAPLDAQQPQPAPVADPAMPALADIMSATQLRHLKLALFREGDELAARRL